MPGSHIPVISVDQLANENFDALLVFPWNIIDEVREQFPDKKMVTAIPELKYWDPLL